MIAIALATGFHGLGDRCSTCALARQPCSECFDEPYQAQRAQQYTPIRGTPTATPARFPGACLSEKGCFFKVVDPLWSITSCGLQSRAALGAELGRLLIACAALGAEVGKRHFFSLWPQLPQFRLLLVKD